MLNKATTSAISGITGFAKDVLKRGSEKTTANPYGGTPSFASNIIERGKERTVANPYGSKILGPTAPKPVASPATTSSPTGRKIGPSEYANMRTQYGVNDSNFGQYFERDATGNIYAKQQAAASPAQIAASTSGPSKPATFSTTQPGIPMTTQRTAPTVASTAPPATAPATAQTTPGFSAAIQSAPPDIRGTQTPAANSALDELRKQYAASLAPGADESALNTQLTDYLGNARLGVSNLEGQGRGIPLDLVRGQQSKLQEQANIGAQTLEQQLANKMAERQGRSTALGTQLEYATQDQTRQDALQQREQDYQRSLTGPQQVGNSILQYDPATGTYKTLYSAPQGAAESPTSVQEYQFAQQNGYTGGYTDFLQAKAIASSTPANLQYISPSTTSSGGTFNPETGVFTPAASTGATSQSQQMTQSALSAIDTLLSSPGFNSAVGAKGLGSLFGILSNPIAGTPSADFRAQFDSLKSILSLDNIKLLKGTGAISDAEQKLLERAASSLTTNMSETAFKAELARVKETLTNSLSRGSQSTTASPYDSLLQNGQITQDEYNELTGSSQHSMNTSKDGSIKLGSRLAVANNNPGNLRFAGQAGATQGQGGFARFPSPQDGYKALLNQISLDASRGHSLSSFISKYAPSSENNTSQYIQQMASAVGVPANTPLKNIDLNALGRAMARKESSSVIA